MNKKTALILGGLVLAAALSAAAILMPKAPGATAVISKDGQVLYEIDLDTLLEPKTLRIEGEDGQVNLVEVSRGRVRMVSATCPDQICVHQGYIDSDALPIVCLPHKVIITIEGGEDSLDTAAK